jgi:hypothetical protein
MRNQDVRRVAVPLVAIGLTAMSMTGCGSSSQSGGSPATAVGSSASASGSSGVLSSKASAAGSTSGGSTHPIDVCATLSAASAAKLSGQAITTAIARTGLQPQEYGCAYGSADDSVQVEVTVFEHDAAFSYDMFLSGSKKASTVNGLGDKAFFDNDGTMYVLSGHNLIQVNGLKTADQCAALARPVLAAL